MPERLTINRRQILRILGGALIGSQIPEFGLETYRQWIIADRLSRQPKLLDSPPQYPILKGTYPHDDDFQRVHTWDNAIGARADIVGFFLKDTNQDRVINQINNAIDEGRLPFIKWGSWIVMGYFKQTKEFLRLAETLKQIKGPFLFGPWFEMNAKWAEKWYGNLNNHMFKTSWHLLYEKLDAKRIPASLVFNPNVTTLHPIAWVEPFENLYPADKYNDCVEFLALDLYYKNSTNPFNFLRYYGFLDLPPEVELGPDVKTFQEIAPGKKIILGEINAAIEDEHERGKRLGDTLTYAVRAGMRGWCTFDWDQRGKSFDEINWDTTKSPQVVHAVRQEVSKPYYYKAQGRDSLHVLEALRAVEGLTK